MNVEDLQKAKLYLDSTHEDMRNRTIIQGEKVYFTDETGKIVEGEDLINYAPSISGGE